MTLEELQKIASRMGVRIDDDSFDGSPGFWLVNAETGDGVWHAGNFSSSLQEVEGKLQALAYYRGLKWGGVVMPIGQRPALDQMPLTSGDVSQAIEVVWAALERLDLNDAEQGQLNTAMAWLKEAAEEAPG